MNTSSDGCHANPSIFVDFNSSSCIETLPSDELPNIDELLLNLVIVNPALPSRFETSYFFCSAVCRSSASVKKSTYRSVRITVAARG